MLAQFPFKILGFHSDGGSEYVNHEVARMLGKELIDFTRSRPRHCNDNALAESKNGNVVRRQFGYSYIPAERASLFNDFCKAHLNPFLNFHRPCLFGTEVPDPRKPGRLRRIHRHEDVMTAGEARQPAGCRHLLARRNHAGRPASAACPQSDRHRSSTAGS